MDRKFIDLQRWVCILTEDYAAAANPRLRLAMPGSK